MAVHLEELIQRDKPHLIRNILQTHGGYPEALATVIIILKHFTVDEPILWEIVLKRCATVGAWSELRKLLPSLRKFCPEVTRKSLCAYAWDKLIEHLFATKEDDKCIEAVNLLQVSCMFVFIGSWLPFLNVEMKSVAKLRAKNNSVINKYLVKLYISHVKFTD